MTMENFFSYISKPIDPEEFEFWVESNNICFLKLELYETFVKSLVNLVSQTYLGESEFNETNIKFLVDNNCHIWDGDAYKRYSIIAGMTAQIESLTQEEFINKIKTDDEFAKKWGELGPIYGKQWRSWGRRGKYVVNEDLNFASICRHIVRTISSIPILQIIYGNTLFYCNIIK